MQLLLKSINVAKIYTKPKISQCNKKNAIKLLGLAKEHLRIPRNAIERAFVKFSKALHSYGHKNQVNLYKNVNKYQ